MEPYLPTFESLVQTPIDRRDEIPSFLSTQSSTDYNTTLVIGCAMNKSEPRPRVIGCPRTLAAYQP